MIILSANVWFEEVNTGLVKEIKDSVKFKNVLGELVPIDDKAVTIRRPEEEFMSEVYPCVSIYNRGSRYDAFRDSREPVIVERDIENQTVTMEDPAVPFNLEVQIDFWSKYQSDMDSITSSWLMKHFRQFNLEVIDDGGTPRSCNCLRRGNLVKSDLVSGGERLFHSTIIYTIWVELDSETRYNKPMVVERGFNAHP